MIRWLEHPDKVGWNQPVVCELVHQTPEFPPLAMYCLMVAHLNNEFERMIPTAPPKSFSNTAAMIGLLIIVEGARSATRNLIHLVTVGLCAEN